MQLKGKIEGCVGMGFPSVGRIKEEHHKGMVVVSDVSVRNEDFSKYKAVAWPDMSGSKTIQCPGSLTN